MALKQISVLQLDNGKEPFQEWFKQLEKTTKAAITSYIHRVASGGSQKNVKGIRRWNL